IPGQVGIGLPLGIAQNQGLRPQGDLTHHGRSFLPRGMRPPPARSLVTKPIALQAQRLAVAEPIRTISPGAKLPAIPSSLAIFSPAVPPKTKPPATPTVKRIAASRRPEGKM